MVHGDLQERVNKVVKKSEHDRIMQDNKHYKAEKVGGFWQFVEKFPPANYEGRHRVKLHGSNGPVTDRKGNPKEVMMNCVYCRRYMEDQEIELDTASMRKLLETAES